MHNTNLANPIFVLNEVLSNQTIITVKPVRVLWNNKLSRAPVRTLNAQACLCAPYYFIKHMLSGIKRDLFKSRLK